MHLQSKNKESKQLGLSGLNIGQYEGTRISSCFSLMVLVMLMLLGYSSESFSQSHTIENVSFTVLEKNVIVVNYDLIGEDRRYMVGLTLRRKNTPHYRFEPEVVMGDVGKGKFAGKNRKIVWSLDNEEQEKFWIDPYADDFYFEVNAQKRGGAGWFWATILIGGAGAAYYYFVLDN